MDYGLGLLDDQGYRVFDHSIHFNHNYESEYVGVVQPPNDESLHIYLYMPTINH